MSTRFTQLGTPMADSQSLRLVLGATDVRDRITEHVARRLRERGYEGVSPSVLNFLGALDCGVNYGSEIARSLDVSRQMVAKTVKEMCRAGYLEQEDGPGKQKRILFTPYGEQLMSEVRQMLAQLDETLHERLGAAALDEAIATLETIDALLDTGASGEQHDAK